jgi:hypothetical protein
MTYDDMLEKFNRAFTDPAKALGRDDSDYNWSVPKWSTEDALKELFGDQAPEIQAQLVGDLSAKSEYWVRDSELAASTRSQDHHNQDQH